MEESAGKKVVGRQAPGLWSRTRPDAWLVSIRRRSARHVLALLQRSDRVRGAFGTVVR